MSAAVPPVVAPAPTNNYTEYRQCCAEQAAAPPEEWTFKRDPRYRRILEHVTREQGEVLLEVAQEAAGPLWDGVCALLPEMVAENDRYGQPIAEHFPSLGLTCSPSNLRYLAHALMVWQHVQRLRLPIVHFVELGGGYGGLALYVYRLRGLFLSHRLSYTMFDVPEAAHLQSRYLANLGLPVRALNGLLPINLRFPWLDEGDAVEPHYCISAFAFSEFDRDTQNWYRERLVRHCQHGFIVWNFVLPLVNVAEKVLGGPVYPFIDAPLTVVPERPSTGPGNVVVTW